MVLGTEKKNGPPQPNYNTNTSNENENESEKNKSQLIFIVEEEEGAEVKEKPSLFSLFLDSENSETFI